LRSPTPDLGTAYDYVALDLPAHFIERGGRGGGGGRGGRGAGGTVAGSDNTPEDNPVTNAGATLGRVLFYDVRLSANNTVACASCHQQAHNFSDPRIMSLGFSGGPTARHSMSLANARFNGNGRFFWDERASTLEEQVLMPIQDSVEMNLPLPDLEAKLARTTFYPDLFTSAFGDPAITSHRISLALAQFVRSMVSANSKFDQALAQGRQGTELLTAEEQLGRNLFEGRREGNLPSLPCSQCHRTAVQVTSNGGGGRGGRASTMNIGLESVTTDQGAGNGRFKAPSLRNIAVSAPYMHDGRFATLEDVVNHYSEGIQGSRGLDGRLRSGRSGQPIRFNLSDAEKAALVAFMKTLTDQAFLTDPKYGDPFKLPEAPKGSR
jgi:cytochrome c peroxidase